MRTITTGDMMHVHGGFAAGVDYTVRLTVRLSEPVDEGLLSRALTLTQKRYPYLCVRIERGVDAFFYEDNPLPVALLHTDDPVRLNSEAVNFHLWAVCWNEDRIHLDTYHGLTDGTGMYEVLSTLFWYYGRERWGLSDRRGIRTLEDPVDPEELRDPQDTLEPPKADRPEDKAAAPMPEAFTLETDGGLTLSEPTIWDVEVPEAAFVRFSSAHDASPGTMVSVLMARAAASLYPDRKKEIRSVYVINARPMLGAGKTCHNCLGMAIFPYTEKLARMPLAMQCTCYRGMTFLQSDGDAVRKAVGANASAIRAAVLAAGTLEEKKKVFGPAFTGGDGHVTFLVSYTGKWRHPEMGEHMKEFWTHAPNTFSLSVQVAAAGGKIFLSIQQRFKENTVREAFLRQLEDNGIPYIVRRKMGSDIARCPEP